MSPDDYKQFSERELKLGLWFTRYRVVIKAIFLSLGYLTFGILIFFNINSIVDYYSSNEIGKIQQALIERDVWQTVSRVKFQPQKLIWRPVEVIERAGVSFDLVVEVTNPNPKWAVTNFTYHFILPGWQSDKIESYLLPGQTRRLVLVNLNKKDLGIGSINIQSARVGIDGISWRRVKEKDYYINNKFIPLGLSADKGSIRKLAGNLTELNFLVKNNSDYNYSKVEITTFLYNGSRVVAANFLQLNNVLSAGSYPVSLRWFGDLPAITSWQVDLSANILAEDNLLKFTKDQFE